MITLSEDFKKRIKDEKNFKLFSIYVFEQIEQLDSVKGLSEMDNQKAGEEAKIRLKAKITLENILKPFIDFSEKQKPTEEEINAAKSRVGLD